ncbi:MAG: nucleotidyltransferase domain-containing protein [Bacteroidota bacterium]
MKQAIVNKLQAIENDYQVTILLASEAGSRAWGFPSPDSDYDVRFVYRRQADDYLSLFSKSDVIELGVNDTLDIGGWDLDKALRLLGKSNVPLMEWVYSPLVYWADPDFLERMRQLAQIHFVPAAGYYHYQSMAKKYVELCKAKDYKLKHLFYALRTALAANWIVEKQTMPPVGFDRLLEELPVYAAVREEVAALTALKATQPESYRHSASEILRTFLQQVMRESEGKSKKLPGRRAVVPKKDVLSLDRFFKEVVRS